MQSPRDGKVIRLWAAPAAAGSGDKRAGEQRAGATAAGAMAGATTGAPRHDIPTHLRRALPTRLVEDAWWLAPPAPTAQVLAFPAAARFAPPANVVRLRRQPGPQS